MFVQARDIRRSPIRAVIAALCLLFALVGCQDTRLLVIFENRSPCDGIRVELTRQDTGEQVQDEVPTEGRREFVVEPNVFYHIRIDYTTARTPGNVYRCTLIEEYDVRLPEGSLPQRYVLEAAEATPIAP